MLLDGNSLTRETFQGEIDSAPEGEVLSLFRELAGPVALKRGVEMDGNGSEVAEGYDGRAVICALKGPVVRIDATGVTLRNLRIEVTAEHPETADNEDCALVVEAGADVRLENVEVRGAVVGLATEEGQWWYPYAVDLGSLAHSQDYDLMLRLCVPVACRISSYISGLEVWPSTLSPGQNEVHLRLSALPKEALLHGHLSLTTALLKRRITVTGRVYHNSSNPAHAMTISGAIIWEPPDWESPADVGEKSSAGAVTTNAPAGGGDSAEPPRTLASPQIKKRRKRVDAAGGGQPIGVRNTGTCGVGAVAIAAATPKSSPISAGNIPPAPDAGAAAGSPEPQAAPGLGAGPRKGSKPVGPGDGSPQRKSKPIKVVLIATAEPRDGGRVLGTGEYPNGVRASVRAKENPKWRFGRWSGDFNGKDNPTSVAMDGDKKITAHFERASFVVTAAAEPREGGKVQGSGEYPNGQDAQVQADPSAEWRFGQWSGDLAGADNPASVRVDGDKRITAHFVKMQNFVLAAEARGGRGGSVEGSGSYSEGKVALIMAVAKNGWRFDHWTGDVAGAANPTQVTIDGEKSVVAHFVREGTIMQRLLAALESPMVVLPFCTGLTLLDALWVWRKGVAATIGVGGVAVLAGTSFAFSALLLLRRLFKDD
jgi:hypothetical protein